MKTYGPTMQCNNKSLDYVKCSKCPPMAITHAIGLNHHRSIVCLSIRRCLSLSTRRTGYRQTHSCSNARIRFCN